MTFETKVEKWGNLGWDVDVPRFCELFEERCIEKKKKLKKNILDKEKTDLGPVYLVEVGKKGDGFIDIGISNYDEMITSRYDYEALVIFRNKLDNIIELFE
jgi:hypothetical protein